MITLKFPALEKALTKDVKDLLDDDPRRGILVLDNNAIIFTDMFCLVVNLYDYFTLECGIEDEEEIKELRKILYYLDEKSISKEFWSELTKGSNMSVVEGNLIVENPKFTKDLHLKETPINFLEPLRELVKEQSRAEDIVSAISLPFVVLQTIYSVLSTDFKHDWIIFQFADLDKPVKFTFRKRKHFYGYILPHFDSVQEGFKFDNWNVFANNSHDFLKELEEEAKAKAIIPPPPAEVPTDVEVDGAQTTLLPDEKDAD